MSVPEALAWLETLQTPQAHVYSPTIIGEISRLTASLEACSRELDELDRLRDEAVTAHRKLQHSFGELEGQAVAAREDWDARRTEFEGRLAALGEKVVAAENLLKDIHYGLLNQPELTREDLANAITSLVTPYKKGERP